jgi:hypothetical protein
MGFRILEQQQWIATAVSTDDRPICAFCASYRLHRVRVGHEPTKDDWYCRHHLCGGAKRMCTMFVREPGSDDE